MYTVIKKYKPQGRLVAFVSFLFIVLILFSVQWEVKDPPLEEIIPELDLSQVVIQANTASSSSGGASAASKNDNPNPTKEQATERVVTNTTSDTQTNSGKGDKPSGQQVNSDLTFNGNGEAAEGEDGIGKEPGEGTKTGKPGQGKGGGVRFRSNASDCSLPSDKFGAEIKLILTVTPEGRVIDATYVKEGSNTDGDVVTKLIQVAKDCFKFTPISGNENSVFSEVITLK
jgi:hypothetical protein